MVLSCFLLSLYPMSLDHGDNQYQFCQVDNCTADAQ